MLSLDPPTHLWYVSFNRRRRHTFYIVLSYSFYCEGIEASTSIVDTNVWIAKPDKVRAQHKQLYDKSNDILFFFTFLPWPSHMYTCFCVQLNSIYLSSSYQFYLLMCLHYYTIFCWCIIIHHISFL